MIFENSNLVTDALHCASRDVTRDKVDSQRFARGIIVGMLAFGQALGYADRVLRGIIWAQLPKDYDPMALPATAPAPVEERFVVHEHHNGFELEDLKTGKRHWLSDGVDCVSSGREGEYLSPGEPGFAEIWAGDFNNDVAETLEAYWPEECA